MPFPDSMCVLIAELRRCEVARLERVDDRAVLPGEVLAALEPAAANHLHHQVHGQLPIDVREHLVPARSIWNSWKAALAASHSSCEIAASDSTISARNRSSFAPVDRADRALGRVQLEREAHVVPVDQRLRRHRRDVVPAARLDREQALRDEARQGMVHRAARDAELGRELVQAQLRAGPGSRRSTR